MISAGRRLGRGSLWCSHFFLLATFIAHLRCGVSIGTLTPLDDKIGKYGLRCSMAVGSPGCECDVAMFMYLDNIRFVIKPYPYALYAIKVNAP